MQCLRLNWHRSSDARHRVGAGWKKRGGKVTIAGCSCPDVLQARLKNEGIAYEPLPETEAGGKGDAVATNRVAKKLSASCLVIDGYEFDAAYQSLVRLPNRPLLVIDDYGHAEKYFADLILKTRTWAWLRNFMRHERQMFMF